MYNHKIPKGFAEKWIDALRSGKYEQGQEYLFSNGKYCCLGVACHLSGIDDDFLLRHNQYLLCSPALKGIPEIKSMSLLLTDDRELNRILADKNDKGKSFSEIADWIEANVEFVEETTHA